MIQAGVAPRAEAGMKFLMTSCCFGVTYEQNLWAKFAKLDFEKKSVQSGLLVWDVEGNSWGKYNGKIVRNFLESKSVFFSPVEKDIDRNLHSGREQMPLIFCLHTPQKTKQPGKVFVCTLLV